MTMYPPCVVCARPVAPTKGDHLYNRPDDTEAWVHLHRCLAIYNGEADEDRSHATTHERGSLLARMEEEDTDA